MGLCMEVGCPTPGRSELGISNEILTTILKALDSLSTIVKAGIGVSAIIGGVVAFRKRKKPKAAGVVGHADRSFVPLSRRRGWRP